MYGHNRRITELCASTLKKIKLGDTVGVDVTGPAYVVAPDDNGNPAMQVGWIVTVWLKHNVLLDAPDVGVCIPLRGVLPPDGAFEQVTKLLLDQARELRIKMANVPAEPDRVKLPAPEPARDPVKPRMRESHFKSDPKTRFGPSADDKALADWEGDGGNGNK